MAEHNLNASGGDLCPLIDDSPSQNEADDYNINSNIIVDPESSSSPSHGPGQATSISPPPRKRPQPKKGRVHLKSNIGRKSVDDLVAEYDKYLEDESAHDLCFSKKGSIGSCTCLHILRQPHPRRLVARYLAVMAVESKTEKNHKESVILEWYKHAIANKHHHKGNNMYSFPFDASDADGSSGAAVYESDGDDPLGSKALLGKVMMCQQGLYRVMGISDGGMQRIREAAATTGVLRPHGLTGKDGNNNMRKRKYTHGATMYSADGGVDDDETANATTSEGVEMEMTEKANEYIVDGATMYSADGGVDDDETANATTSEGVEMEMTEKASVLGEVGMQNENSLTSTDSSSGPHDCEDVVAEGKGFIFRRVIYLICMCLIALSHQHRS